MKELFIIVIILIAFAIGCANKTEKSMSATIDIPYHENTYPGYAPVVYSYKDYQNEPSIDSIEFYNISESKQHNCRVFYSKYMDLTDEELLLMEIDESDGELVYEFYTRFESCLYISFTNYAKLIISKKPDIQKMLIKYREIAYNMGIFDAVIYLGKYESIEEKIAMLSAYERLSPLGAYYKYLAISQLQWKEKNKKLNKQEKKVLEINSNYRSDFIEKARNAGKYYAILGIAVGIQSELLGEPDKDMLCEAYYNGCYSLYELKENYKIKCGE